MISNEFDCWLHADDSKDFSCFSNMESSFHKVSTEFISLTQGPEDANSSQWTVHLLSYDLNKLKLKETSLFS